MRRDVVHGVATRAFSSGKAVQRSFTHVEADFAAGCLDPIIVHLEGRPDRNGPDTGKPGLAVTMETRCRRCRWCLHMRSREWSNRCKIELGRATRSWFGTLTMRPEEHYYVQCLASVRLEHRGVNWDKLSANEQFQERVAVVGREVTGWLKRIRKNSHARLRFCLVAEAHKEQLANLPHFHVLIHEVDECEHVTKRVLQETWRLGFSQFKLCADGNAANYVTKYLHKSAMARVRASLHYGKMQDDLTS